MKAEEVKVAGRVLQDGKGGRVAFLLELRPGHHHQGAQLLKLGRRSSNGAQDRFRQPCPQLAGPVTGGGALPGDPFRARDRVIESARQAKSADQAQLQAKVHLPRG